MHVVYCHYTVSVTVLWLFATNKDVPGTLCLKKELPTFILMMTSANVGQLS